MENLILFLGKLQKILVRYWKSVICVCVKFFIKGQDFIDEVLIRQEN